MSDKVVDAKNREAFRSLRHIFGTTGIQAALSSGSLLVALGLFVNALWDLLKPPYEGCFQLHYVVGIGLLPLVSGLLYLRANRHRETLRADIDGVSPSPVKGLILYLSTLDRGTDPAALEGALKQGLSLAAFRERFGQSNWRMPIEAIAFHADPPQGEAVLARVAVIPSADAHGSDGSWRQVPLFRLLVETLFPGAKFSLTTVGEMDPEYAQGIDFEREAKRLMQATDRLYEHLREDEDHSKEVVIDITGGRKVASIVGSAVALAEGRLVQYVSCSAEGCNVQMFDLTFADE